MRLPNTPYGTDTSTHATKPKNSGTSEDMALLQFKASAQDASNRTSQILQEEAS